MSEYTPTTEQVEARFAHEPGYECSDPLGYASHVQANRKSFKRWLAEDERAAAEKILKSFAEHLLTTTMPTTGINMTQYREGLMDGVHLAVIAASRFSRTEEEE